MLQFYTNRTLSEKLGINLAKWKRWSREFLPPDPLGGMQSGFARQYHPNEAFTVYLGGLLVADLKCTIPETKQILGDLHQWLLNTGFYYDPKAAEKQKQGVEKVVERYLIYIDCPADVPEKRFEFTCTITIRGVILKQAALHNGFSVLEERYVERSIGPRTKKNGHPDGIGMRVLNITGVLEHFLEKLGRDRASYRALA